MIKEFSPLLSPTGFLLLQNVLDNRQVMPAMDEEETLGLIPIELSKYRMLKVYMLFQVIDPLYIG